MSDTTSGSWEEPHYTSFLLWDIDREFQNAREAYEEWLSKNRRRRALWKCIVGGSEEDTLSRTLNLGRRVQKCVEDGQEEFGARFDRGDSPTHTILSAQLLRLQHEVNVPLWDCLHSRIPLSIPYDDLIRTIRSVRRAVLHALRGQTTRLSSLPLLTPCLPPPRFSIAFCPFALQLQKDAKIGNVVMKTKKFRPHDRYDDREICPYCTAHISVAAHSGLPEYRRLLFQSHTQTSPEPGQTHIATFACSGCYKTFDDSYAFLDHIFQKEIDSERSCLRLAPSPRFSMGSKCARRDSRLVEKCLRNCLRREMTRAKMLKREGSERSNDNNAIGSSNSTGGIGPGVGKRIDIGEKRDSAMSMGKETQVSVRSVDSRYSSNFFGQGVEGY